MNKVVARQIADEKLRSVLDGDAARILSLLEGSEHEFVERDGVEYQLRTNAFYDDRTEKVIRVNVEIDDQKFWSSLMPLTRSDFYRMSD